MRKKQRKKGPPPVPAAAVVIRPALPMTLPRTAAIPRAPHPHLKTVAVTAMTVPALLPPPPRLPPVLTLIPQAVLIKALQRREKRRNEGPINRSQIQNRVIYIILSTENTLLLNM